jgi:hypothetical protein
MSNIISSPPTMIITKFFKQSRRRVTRSARLRIAIKKIKGNHFKHNRKE